MSKFLKISSAAVLSVLYAAPALASITPPTIYGGLYLDTRGSEDKVTKTYSDGTKTVEKTKYRQQLYDNGSRMGIRGEEALNDDMSVLYRFEWRSPLDTEQRAFEPRDSWLAIKHKTVLSKQVVYYLLSHTFAILGIIRLGVQMATVLITPFVMSRQLSMARIL